MTPEEQAMLHDLLYAVRGLKRALYKHSTITQNGGADKRRFHRCKVCNQTSINDALIPHHPWCSLDRLQIAWKALKDVKPEMFDFSDKFPKKVGP